MPQMDRPIDAVFRTGLVGWEALAAALVITAIDDGELIWFRTNLGQVCLHLLGYAPRTFMEKAKVLARPDQAPWEDRTLLVERWEELRKEGMTAKDAARHMGRNVKWLYESRTLLRETGRL